jgi:uncharacterized protein
LPKENYVRVIDFHLHPGPLNGWIASAKDFFREYSPEYCAQYADEIDPKELIAFLRLQGVDRCVLLAEYAPACTGVVSNEQVSRLCAGHDELVPFGSICVYDTTPYAEQAQHAVEKLGVRGFKLLPSYQFFYPNDPSMFHFYEYAQSLGLPVMFHTGTSLFKGTRIKYADPLLLDDVADAFPRLTIVMEHGGRPFWFDRAAWLISKYENMHIGTAGIPIKKLPHHFPQLERLGDRFIFGSDWPGMFDIKGLIERVMHLPIAEEVKEMILHGNAERILK